eukprot:7343312-Alexandrium_andersonii.AAC.1
MQALPQDANLGVIMPLVGAHASLHAPPHGACRGEFHDGIRAHHTTWCVSRCRCVCSCSDAPCVCPGGLPANACAVQIA